VIEFSGLIYFYLSGTATYLRRSWPYLLPSEPLMMDTDETCLDILFRVL
jgi:hypothetical protein